jgi:hypothetical protein
LLKLLEDVARRKTSFAMCCQLAVCWIALAVLALALIGIRRGSGWESVLTIPLILLLAVALAVWVWRRRTKAATDPREVAADIESHYPELDGRLITAVQQQTGKGGSLNFLQERVISEALDHGRRHRWIEILPNARLRVARLLPVFSLILLGTMLLPLRPTPGQRALVANPTTTRLTVTPGDVMLEKGASLVVLARFAGTPPAAADLVIAGIGGGPEQRAPLVKSLSDPMFGGSVPEVASNFTYRVDYSGERSPVYQVRVFEHPRLERADVDLVFPEYTAQPPKSIPDTRRVSAVEGSLLDLKLQLNKPVVSARLAAKDKDHSAIPLVVETNRPVVRLDRYRLDAGATYELQLIDDEGRSNKVASQFVFEALKNRAPELKLTSPRGDLRPSPLEEITFEGTAWDDFGVRAYGIGYALAGEEPRFVELGGKVPAKEKRSFHHLLKLEDLGVSTDQLLTWFVWADDIGPNGEVRRNPGDLYFAEVRPFEEVFRESQGNSGQQQEQSQGGGGENPTGKLAELQKQIIGATWKLRREQETSHPGAKTGTRNDAPPKPAGKESTNRFPGQREPGLGTARMEPLRIYSPKVFGSPSPQENRGSTPPVPAPRSDPKRSTPAANAKKPTYADDAAVVRDSQEQALDQAKAARENGGDARAAALWEAAEKQMEKALQHLKRAPDSPAALAEALAAEQAAYQALLKLQEHEYQVSRSRQQQSGQQSRRQQQMQRQLEQMELTQSEDRYETQRQAQRPQSAERNEQLQIQNRLQELARRQQDLNERLKELQTALQEARTQREREEIERRLKRLQEEERQMLQDLDELRQRMDRPENQSRMAEERRQLEQTREQVQRAAEAAGQGQPSEALAAGTKAQRQLQDIREQMRKESSSQFSEEMREMRSQARELARQQEDILKKIQSEDKAERRTLSDSTNRLQTLEQLARQRSLMTNLVDRATQISQEAEAPEPILSRQLYDTVRKFSQDTAKDVKDVQDELLTRGLMTRNLYDQLNEPTQQDGAKLLNLTSEMLRTDFLPQAAEAGQRSRGRIEDFKRGVERAAESVIGDDTEALRQARRELENLTEDLKREMAQAEGARSQTNGQAGDQGTNATSTASGGGQRDQRQQQQQQQQGAGQGGTEIAQNQERQQAREGQPGEGEQDPEARAGQSQQPGRNQAANAGQRNRQPGNRPQSGQTEGQPPQPGQEPGQEQAQTQAQQAREPGNSPQDQQQQQQQQSQAAQGQQPTPGTGNQPQTAQANQPGQNPQGRGPREGNPRQRARLDGGQPGAPTGGSGDPGQLADLLGEWNRAREGENTPRGDANPLTGEGFVPWSERLGEVEEMLDFPDMRRDVATARERARNVRQEFKNDRKKPDWAVVRLQVIQPLLEVRDRIADELAKRESRENIVPTDRDPVPSRYSELVRRYYEELGKDKQP